MDVSLVLRKDIENIVKTYYKTFSFPRDDFWEKAFILDSKTYLISEGNIAIGFFSINKDNAMTEFFVDKRVTREAQSIFKEIVKSFSIKVIYAETSDINYTILALESSVKNETMFNIYEYVLSDKKNIVKSKLKTRLASCVDLEELVELELNNLKTTDEDFLRTYLKYWVNNKGIYLFTLNEEIVGFGEFRVYRNSKVVYLGVIVRKEFRGLGYGTYILKTLNEIANYNELISIISSSIENRVADRTIKAAGFNPTHRIIKYYL